MRRTLLLLGLVGAASGLPGLSATGTAAEHRVDSAADIGRLEGKLGPGDVLVMADGTWTDQAIVFRGKGTEDRPLSLRAQTPGKVVLTGKSSLEIDGEHLVVGGLCFLGATSARDGVKISGR